MGASPFCPQVTLIAIVCNSLLCSLTDLTQIVRQQGGWIDTQSQDVPNDTFGCGTAAHAGRDALGTLCMGRERHIGWCCGC